jgi:hypothetical protein
MEPARGTRVLRRERAGHEIRERLLGLLPVVLIHVDHQRRDAPMPTVRANLVEPQTGPLPEFGRLRDARVAQTVTPDMQADLLPELADNTRDRARLERAVAMLSALAPGLKERSRDGAAVLQIAADRGDDDGRQRDQLFFLPALPFDPRIAPGQVRLFERQAAEF